MSTSKTVREVTAIAHRMGYRIVEVFRGKHLKFYVTREGWCSPKCVTVSVSASDRRAMLNIKSDFKRLEQRT